MAKRTPLIKNNVLEVRDWEADRVVYKFNIADPNEWEYWQAFLENNKSFRYVWTNRQGIEFSFSGVKEKRKHLYGEILIWIAHKRVGGKLRRKYLGAARNLTAKKLQNVALEISQGKLPKTEQSLHTCRDF